MGPQAIAFIVVIKCVYMFMVNGEIKFICAHNIMRGLSQDRFSFA